MGDVELVWSNCCLFNGNESLYGKLALKLRKSFHKRLSKAGLTVSTGVLCNTICGSLCSAFVFDMGVITCLVSLRLHLLPAAPSVDRQKMYAEFTALPLEDRQMVCYSSAQWTVAVAHCVAQQWINDGIAQQQCGKYCTALKQ